MKTFLLIASLLLYGTIAEAQEIFFPSKVGVVLEYKNYDKKEKETGTTRYTIIEVTKRGNDKDITYLMEKMELNNAIEFENKMTVHIKDNMIYVDMGKIIKQAILKKKGDIPKGFTISGTDIVTPSNISAGDTLPNSQVDMTIKKGILKINVSMKITDRLVESVANKGVKAGNFEAYKMTSKMEVKAMGIKTNMQTTEWQARGIGMIRSESYDGKGRLESFTELVSIKR